MKSLQTDRIFMGISSYIFAFTLVVVLFAVVLPAKGAIFSNPNPGQTAIDPGLVITGYVRLNDQNGIGVENVEIFRSYAAYPGDQIAITDDQGYYDSGYYFIPGGENVTVWATKDGYNLDPQQYHWRHYYGYEEKEMDFVANPLITDCSEPPSPNRILVNRGDWQTTERSQNINITMGQGAKTITVTSEAGIVSETANFSSSASMTVPLQMNTINHIRVDIKFEEMDGCYYITGTEFDDAGLPLTIAQVPSSQGYLPLILVNH
jgi:hypothetical protein